MAPPRLGRILKVLVIASSLVLSGCEPITTILGLAFIIGTIAQCSQNVGDARKANAEAEKAERENEKSRNQ